MKSRQIDEVKICLECCSVPGYLGASCTQRGPRSVAISQNVNEGCNKSKLEPWLVRDSGSNYKKPVRICFRRNMLT